MNHNHQSVATPWNPNLSYAIDWSIVMGTPIVLLTVRHLIITVGDMLAKRNRRRGQAIATNDRLMDDDDADDDDEGELHHGQQPHHSQQDPRHDIPASTHNNPAFSSAHWSYSRIENYMVNKASATFYLGSIVHLVAGATLLALILLSILAVLLLINGDLMRNSNRAGYLALSCIPFLFAFTGKNSIITYMTGMSHHRINQIHRFLGLCLFILVSVHMGCMIHVWWPWQFLMDQQMATPKVRYGLATYGTLCLIVLTAAWPVRRWAYEAFVVSHSLFLVFLVLVGLHTPYAMRFTAAGIFCYVLNVLTGWCIKTRMAHAQATVYQNRLTRLRIHTQMCHAPGQHIYVCVPSMSLIQWHPFTISSADQTSLTVHARAVGGFTRKLCRWPENTQRRVIVAGPYGGAVKVARGLDSHKVVFVAAGSGLAYIVPILTDLLRSRRLQKMSNGAIEIVWCVRDPDEVQWFQDELEMVLNSVQSHPDSLDKDKEDVDLITTEGPETRFHLVIHYSTVTFADQESLVVRQSTSMTSTATASASTTTATAKTALNAPFAGDERVEWMRSRLDVCAYITKQIEDTPRDKAIDIVGCGPPLMLAELHNAVAGKEELSGCRVNLHTERFYM